MNSCPTQEPTQINDTAPKEPKRRQWLWTILFVAIAAVSVFAVASQSKEFSLSQFTEFIQEASIPWLAVALLSMLCFILFEGLAVLWLCRAFGYRRGLKNGFLSSHIGGGETLPVVYKEYYDFVGWCTKSDLSDEPILKQGASRNLYPKFTPTQYTIDYELNGGLCSQELIKSYNIESATFNLPSLNEMSIIEGSFGGWYDNPSFEGEVITQIVLGSNGNKKLYAKWIMNAPTVVELSDADKAVFDQVTPTIVVGSTFNAGKYIMNELTYEAGKSAFTTISAALNSATENSIIYVFTGTYSDDLNISTQGITIIGPNYNINANNTRVSETVITGITTINANNTEINGIKFTGSTAYIELKESTNVSLLNIYSDATGYGYVKDNGNRKAFIYSGATVKNLVIKTSYFTVGDSLYCKDVITSYGTINGMTLEANTFTHSYAGSTTTEMITATKISGIITINNNFIEYPNGNFSIMLGAYSNSCTKIDITNNIFGGGKYLVAGLYIRKAPANCIVNIIGSISKSESKSGWTSER